RSLPGARGLSSTGVGAAGGGPAARGRDGPVDGGPCGSTGAAGHARAPRGPERVPLPPALHPRPRGDSAPISRVCPAPAGRAAAGGPVTAGDRRGLRGRVRRPLALRADVPPRGR